MAARIQLRFWYVAIWYIVLRHCSILHHVCLSYHSSPSWVPSSQVEGTAVCQLALCNVMVTSWRGNTFHINGHLWGNPPATGGFPLQSISNAGFRWFSRCLAEQVVEQTVELLFETPWRSTILLWCFKWTVFQMLASVEDISHIIVQHRDGSRNV